MDIVQMCYWHRANDDVFETCINTLSKVSPRAHLQVHTDDRPLDLSRDYGIKWSLIDKERVKGRRALCKIEELQRVMRALAQGDRLIVADVDIYWLGDPFEAFKKDFDMAVTTRCHEYRWPVNGGVFFFNVNRRTKRFVDFYAKQCVDHNWPPLVEFREDRPYTPDWEIGQDFLNAAWNSRGNLEVKIEDVGPEYNFCPNSDVFGIQKARDLIRQAYYEKSVKALHLKSELKMCIYDDYMEDAITKRCVSKWNWMSL